MKVLKFGGTSVGTPQSLQQVKKIVESQTQPVVVVVSALGGITDRLIATARMAAEGNPGYEELYREIAERHRNMIATLFSSDDALKVSIKVEPMLDELGNIFRGIFLIGDLSERTLDIVVSYGERISSLITAA